MKVKHNLDKICENQALKYGKFLKKDRRRELNALKHNTEQEMIRKMNMDKSVEHAK